MGAEISETLYYVMSYRSLLEDISGWKTESSAATCCSSADDVGNANLDDIDDLIPRVNYHRDPANRRNRHLLG